MKFGGLISESGSGPANNRLGRARLHELLPWHWKKAETDAAAA